jgi:hypothetical protein
MFILHFMKVSTENDNNFGYEQITILGDNMPLKAYRLSECTSSPDAAAWMLR